MTHSYFITGTDTDCGKTYVTVKLLDHLRQQGASARAIKPVASGCRREQGVWVNDDIARLEQANQTNPANICHFKLRKAISPNLAAAEENVMMTSAEITSFYQNYPKADLDYLLVEGAGGLWVPLNEQETWIDFLLQSGMSVLLVVGMRLGCMNHAFLTAYALEHHHIPVHGWIANFIDPQMSAQAENLQILEQRLHSPLLGTVAYEGRYCHTGRALESPL